MEMDNALTCFAALSQETRLEAVKLLVRAGEDGLPAGEIAQQLGVGNTLMSAHLSKLVRSGLFSSRREGRSIIYSADYACLRSLIQFLMADCCSGVPAIIENLSAVGFTQGA